MNANQSNRELFGAEPVIGAPPRHISPEHLPRTRGTRDDEAELKKPQHAASALTNGRAMLTSIKFENIVRVAPCVQVKFANAEKGIVSGYASSFGGSPDSFGDIVAAGAFARTLAEHKAAGTVPAFLWSHDLARPIGRWDEMTEDSTGLRVVGQLNLETTAGRDALAHMKAGDATGLSIGYSVAEGGRRYERDGSATLTDINLYEVSAVTIPANRDARVSGVKSIDSQRELESLLRDELGLARAAAKKLAAGGWPALANTQQRDSETIAALLRQSAAKFKG